MNKFVWAVPAATVFGSCGIALLIENPFEIPMQYLILLGAGAFFTLKGGIMGFLIYGSVPITLWVFATLARSKNWRIGLSLFAWTTWFICGLLVAGIPV